jgi:DNA transformation protein and related proteins
MTVKRSRKSGGGPLRSLRVSDGFRTFVLDQLSSIEGLRAKPMFGGFGLYADDLFFGILAADALYFKVDDTNRPDYERAKSEAFHPFEDRPMSMSYFSVPLTVLESTPTLASWAETAIAVARSAKKPSTKKGSVTKPSRKNLSTTKR